MADLDWAKVRRIYEEALTIEPAKRSAFLDEACGGEAELRAEIERILRANEGAAAFLERPAIEQLAGLDAEKITSEITGRSIGPYRIVSKLGSGGMGVVYLAVRDDGEFRKQVRLPRSRFHWNLVNRWNANWLAARATLTRSL